MRCEIRFLARSLERAVQLAHHLCNAVWSFSVAKNAIWYSPAPEIFQRRLHQALEGLSGVFVVADDILVAGVGTTNEATTADHDAKLEALFQRCRERIIVLNSKKFQFRLGQIPYLGHIITADGLLPNPAKTEAIARMPVPTDVAAIQRFNGMVACLAKFLPQVAKMNAPLRQLTRKDQPWQWSSGCDRAFQDIKAAVTAAPVLRYFDPAVPLTLQCDASQDGLGAVLLQNDQPIAYASRCLTKTEENYAQIEKELLAIVFGIRRFHQYAFGREVTVQTDHKPLETLAKKALDTAPKRLQRMFLQLQRYNVTVVYRKGKELYLADTLSRASIPSASPPLTSGDNAVYQVDWSLELEQIDPTTDLV